MIFFFLFVALGLLVFTHLVTLDRNAVCAFRSDCFFLLRSWHYARFPVHSVADSARYPQYHFSSSVPDLHSFASYFGVLFFVRLSLSSPDPQSFQIARVVSHKSETCSFDFFFKGMFAWIWVCVRKTISESEIIQKDSKKTGQNAYPRELVSITRRTSRICETIN